MRCRRLECRRDSTPLCPAGHLPRKEGDRMSFPLSQIFNAARARRHRSCQSPPLAGEMAGRPEGGVKDRGSFYSASLCGKRACHPKPPP
ncbi:MAG: hypothetical protein E5Y31_04595 [Mesorhizobium sp.]|nr:MAG: hypothetical protein E5Y31_04595 [Mesorhizobium sp.]